MTADGGDLLCGRAVLRKATKSCLAQTVGDAARGKAGALDGDYKNEPVPPPGTPAPVGQTKANGDYQPAAK